MMVTKGEQTRRTILRTALGMSARTGLNQLTIGMLADELGKFDGTCCGFVVMPDHVRATVWFPQPERLSSFMQNWKSRSSRQTRGSRPTRPSGLRRLVERRIRKTMWRWTSTSRRVQQS